jgi:hypothetical protein
MAGDEAMRVADVQANCAKLLENLRQVDAEAHRRVMATARALLDGGEVPCAVCGAVLVDGSAWQSHVGAGHGADR